MLWLLPDFVPATPDFPQRNQPRQGHRTCRIDTVSLALTVRPCTTEGTVGLPCGRTQLSMTTKHATKMCLGTWTRAIPAILLVLAMLGHGALPLFQKALTKRAEVTVPRDSCCPSTAETPARPSRSQGAAIDRDVPSADDCCPDGCIDCFLPCCHGPLAVYSQTEALASLSTAGPLVPTSATHPAPGDPLGIFRPPRG